MKIHFHAASTERAKHAYDLLTKRYGQTEIGECKTIVVLGGDGTMLDALHLYAEHQKPVYGMNFGSVGFLMNPYHEDDLAARLENASAVQIHALHMKAVGSDGTIHEATAYNEVSLLRETRQTAKLRISVAGVVRIAELVCDGILVATPAGSTAYNLSAHGPILPLSSNMLALTPISAFRPRRWRGALLPCEKTIRIEILQDDKRPVSATADSREFRDIVSVDVQQSSHSRTLLFDPDHHLEERILKEQFLA